MLLTFILQTVSAKQDFGNKKSDSPHLESQVSERKLGLSKKIKSDIGPSNRKLPKTPLKQRGLYGEALTQRINKLYARLDSFQDKNLREMEKLAGIEELSNEVLLKMDKTSESTVTKEHTFADICKTELMVNMPTTTRNFITKFFDESFHYMAWNAFQVKVEIYFHWAEITRYTDVLKKYTNVVLKTYLQRYFTIRMQGLSAFLGVVFNFPVTREEFAGSSIYNFDHYYKSVQKMSYSLMGIAMEYDNLFYFLDKWLGDKIFYGAADEIVDPKNKDLYGDTIKDQVDSFTTKGVAGVLQLVCDTTVTLMNLYFTHASKEVFIKATQTNEASYNFVVEYITNYSDMFTGIHKDGKEVVKDRRFKNCKDLTASSTIYSTFAAYYSMKMLKIDITDEKVFKARSFFTRNAMYYFTDKLSYCTDQYNCDFILLYPENNGRFKNAVSVMNFGKTCVNHLPDIDFLSDFSVVLGWKVEWKQMYDYESYLQTEACVDQTTGELKPKQDLKLCENANIYQAYYLVLKHIYNGYNVARNSKMINFNDANSVERIKKVYQTILKLFISTKALTSMITNGFVKLDEIQRIYVDIIYYLCEKSGDFCDKLKDEHWVIVYNHMITYKIRITRTIITTKIIKIFEEKITIIRNSVEKDEIRKLIIDFKFKFARRECMKSIAGCKDIQTNYLEFTKILIQVFSIKTLQYFSELIEVILNLKNCNIEGAANIFEGCKQTPSWYLWIYLIDTTIANKPPIGKEMLLQIYIRINIYFTNFMTGTVDPESGQVPLKNEKPDGLLTLAFLEKLFGDINFNQITKKSNKLIKFTEEDLILIEQILFYIVYEPEVDKKEQERKVNFGQFSARVNIVLQNMYLQLNLGTKILNKDFITPWKAKMKINIESIKPAVWKPVIEQAEKTSMSLYEMILIKIRLTSYLQGGQFFVLFPADSSFTSTDHKPYANPFTVVFNYFSMIRKEIDEGLFFTNNFISIFYKKVKNCLMETSAGAATKDLDCNQYSHRKFEEIFFFVQALYRRYLPTEDLRKPETPPLTQYYDETKPIVHSKIFMSMYFQEPVSDLMKEIADECEVQKTIIGDNKKIMFTNLNRLCADLHIFNIVYDHIKSTDSAGLNQASFLVRLLSILQEPYPEDDITKLKFALLNTGEIMDYISIGQMHLDRYYNLFDTSKLNKDSGPLKSLGDKSLDKLTKKEIIIFGNYLFRMFGKIDYSSSEEPTSMAVQSLLETTVPEFKEYLTYSNTANYNQFKTVLLFASATQYQKIAELLSSDNKFLQVVLMNNFSSDDKNERILMYVKTLDPTSFLETNKFAVVELLKQPTYANFYSKAIGAVAIMKDIEKYKTQLKRVFYENNQKVEKKTQAEVNAITGKERLHNGKITKEDTKIKEAIKSRIKKSIDKKDEITRKIIMETNIQVTKQMQEKSKKVVRYEVEYYVEDGDEAINRDDFISAMEENMKLNSNQKITSFKLLDIDFPSSVLSQDQISQSINKPGGTFALQQSQSMQIQTKKVYQAVQRSSSMKIMLKKSSKSLEDLLRR